MYECMNVIYSHRIIIRDTAFGTYTGIRSIIPGYS